MTTQVRRCCAQGETEAQKGEGLTRAPERARAELGQSHTPGHRLRVSSPLCPVPWGGVTGPRGSFLLPFPCAVVTGDLPLLGCSVPLDQVGQGKEGNGHPGTATYSHRAQPVPVVTAPTWMRSMQCWGDSADTHWISGRSPCRLKAAAMSPHFWISGADSTHQCR